MSSKQINIVASAFFAAALTLACIVLDSWKAYLVIGIYTMISAATWIIGRWREPQGRVRVITTRRNIRFRYSPRGDGNRKYLLPSGVSGSPC